MVLETGLGGRLDATNVIPSPILTVITKIGLDHTEYLGDTIENITKEKCGVIKSDTKVVTSCCQEKDALSVIENTCKELGVPLYIAEKDSGYPLSLRGEYQKENGGVASLCAKILGVDETYIKKGLLTAKWIARFEYLRDNLILDGGHNPDGVNALISSLKALNKPVHFVVAMMQDKDMEESCRIINDFAKSVTVTEAKIPRCAKAEDLSKLFIGCSIEKDSVKAVEKVLFETPDDEIVCVCGSLYLAGEIRGSFIS